MIEHLKNQNWKALREWLGDFNIMDLNETTLLLNENQKEI